MFVLFLTCIILSQILPICCEFTKVNLRVYKYDPARFSCSPPPDNLDTYGYWEYTFTNNECNGDSGESGLVGPPSLFHSCSPDGSQVILDFYDTSNCNGDESWTMNYATNEIVCDLSDENLGFVNFTCTAENEVPDPDEDTTRATPNCNYFYGMSTNQCVKQQSDDGVSSYKYICIDEHTLEARYYDNGNCDAEPVHSSQQPCDQTDDWCYCGAMENDCLSADVEITFCGNSTVLENQSFKYIINECFAEGNNSSYSVGCENGKFYLIFYNTSNCSDEINKQYFPETCENEFDVAVICSVEDKTSTSTTDTPINTDTTLAGRLCGKEHGLNKYNNCGIFQFNGGCQEHFESLIYQDKSGRMSYAKCCEKCNKMSECKSFLFGKKGVERQNWCNMYSVECTDNGDNDWFMFTPINNADAICNSIN